MMTAAQTIAITIFLFNFFSDSFSETDRLTGLLPPEKSVNDIFSETGFCSSVNDEAVLTSEKRGFEAGTFTASMLSVIFAESVFSLMRDFSAAVFSASDFERALSPPVFTRCVFTAVFTADFPEAFTAFFLTAGFGAFFTTVFVSAFFTPAFAAVFTSAFFATAFSAVFTLFFFSTAFSAVFETAFFAAGFSAVFFTADFSFFYAGAFFAVLALAAFSGVFVLAISLSFAENIPHSQQY